VTTYEAPAKLNLSLLVSSPRSDGFHPLESLVQTVAWCDHLTIEEGEGEDALEIVGREIDAGENLVLEALEAARARGSVPPLSLLLEKRLPIAAGLGGGSSDAAAALRAAVELGGLSASLAIEAASVVGADVALFLTGGSLLMTGVGEKISAVEPLSGFSVAIAVPNFALSTADVYKRWDKMEGPRSEAVATTSLPPQLRGGMPIRNDLLPAALDLQPRLGDFIADLREMWGMTVSMTGSGSACFGYFGSVGEAEDAAASVINFCDTAMGVELRALGVARREQ
jgi:4-diphosphocytidyl-2-C-methyl-D-erythritol kinase